jgi:hypothetical protein
MAIRCLLSLHDEMNVTNQCKYLDVILITPHLDPLRYRHSPPHLQPFSIA